ncbi:MAG TPA: carboxypeptidase regulatory-like domain-containing protein [Bryobacteraceae bacterium]|nr:carboxypeptidase regulatory-like domain-containing protein [Bryobacteraceae bacterium]
MLRGCRFAFIPLLLLCAPLLFAQTTGSITGTVRDNTGAVVAKADVSLTAEGTQTVLKTTTNADGEYLFAAVPAGLYDLAVSAAGFNTYDAKGIVLRVAQRARADATLSVGEVRTTVTVEAAAATQVETESSEVSGLVTGREITQLVLNGRNYTQLISLTPGVSNQTGQEEGTVGVYGSVAWSINGGRTEYNNWELDGGDNMDNGSNGTLNVYPNVDAIQEVRVLTSDYGAQYGRNGSGTVEAVTKSGTKDFHGDAFEFLRNNDFNARNFFSPDVPEYRKNDFGYTIGGPVFIPHHYNKNKDKTFFFWSEDWRREIVPATFDNQVPSTQERQGIFNDVCPAAGSAVNTTAYPDCPVNPATKAYFPSNTVPIDTNAQSIMALVPGPTSGSGAESFYNASFTTPTHWREELFRIDENFTDTNRFFVRYIHDSWNTITPTSLWSSDAFPTVGTNFVGPGTSFVAHLATNVSPTLLNEFTFSYTADHIFLNPSGNLWQRPSSMTMTGLFNNGFGGKLPGVNISGGAAYNGGFTADVAGWPWNNANPTYTYRDQIAKIWGSHNIYAGFYLAIAQKNEQNGAETQGFLTFSNTSPVTTGNAWADFLLGDIANFSQTNAQTKYYYRDKVFEPYFQDDWHVTKRLTLNLGLRMSGYGGYWEKYNQFYNFYPSRYDPSQAPQIDITGSITGVQGDLVPGVGNPYNGEIACGESGTPHTCYKGHFFNWAPRFGFALDPFGDAKWAIRGGYGIFFEHLNGNEGISGLEGQPPGILNPTQYNVVGYTNIGGGGLSGTTGITTYTDQMRWPYVQQWHLDVQHDIAKDTVATVSYVGSKGTHLSWQRDLNQLQPISNNPFQAGQPLTSAICNTVAGAWTPGVTGVVNGQTLTGPAAQNLAVACGSSPADPYRPYIGYSNISMIEPQANSLYNALQISARRSLSHAQFTLAYTWAHSLDDSSDRYDGNFVNSYNMRLTRATSNFDQRQILNIGYVLDAPFFNNTKTLAGKILGGWHLSGLTTFQTGTPFSVYANTGSGIIPGPGVGNGTGTNVYANIIGNPNSAPPITNAADVIGPLLYNPAAFAAPVGLGFGTAQRNVLNLPSFNNWDMGLFKNFFIKEGGPNFEFRAEGFNVFNHAEFNGVNSGISCYGGSNYSAGDASCLDQAFLHPNSARNPRILQLGLKFIF